METSDRGMIDVERFDLEPDRPIFHGLVGDLDADTLDGLSTYEKVPLILRLIGAESMSDRMAASLIDVDTTVKTWPQLASAIAVGGALNTVAARKIALGAWTESGRFYVDVEHELGAQPSAVGASGALQPSAEAPAPEPAAPRLPMRGVLDPASVRSLVGFAAAAPSGGNCQPWAFRFQHTGADSGDVRCLHDATRSRSVLDYDDRASYLALGAAAENLWLAGRAAGFDVELATGACQGGEDPAWTATLRPSAWTTGDALVETIGMRTTNRKRTQRVPLDPDVAQRMQKQAGVRSAMLTIVEEAGDLDVLGEVLARGDRLRYLSPDLHREMFDELRFPGENAEVGLDIRTLELDATERAGIAVTRRPDALAALRASGAGQGLGKPARESIAASSAVGVLRFSGSGSRQECVAAGRALQRVWLQATREGLAIQPWAPLLYLWMRLDAGGDGLDTWQRTELEDIRAMYRTVVPERSGMTDVFLFRIAQAGPPTARSLRLPIDEVFSVEEGDPARGRGCERIDPRPTASEAGLESDRP